ncbi:MAG: protease complex subunit PrcB family protein [Kofleriaceae bacterium]|nr:protease complex subunit PrcB family protein [Kofleriaceae bacterium]
MKRLNSLALFSTLALALAVPSFTACTDVDSGDDMELAEPTDEVEAEKADQATLALTELDVDAPTDRFGERVGVIKSKTRWRQVFGTEAPSSVNFSRQWVAYYTAGAQRSGGFTASVTKIRVSPSGKTLTVVTNLKKPGAGCIVTANITFPYAVVAFKKPAVTPTSVRYSKQSTEYSCEAECRQVDIVASYIPSTDDKECEVTTEHCLTPNLSSCPQITPLPPTFCPGGYVEPEPRYLAAADGAECYLPRLHCITNDSQACPQRSPLPPNFCADGTIKTGRTYVPSADGKECSMPAVHCVTNNPTACPF